MVALLLIAMSILATTGSPSHAGSDDFSAEVTLDGTTYDPSTRIGTASYTITASTQVVDAGFGFGYALDSSSKTGFKVQGVVVSADLYADQIEPTELTYDGNWRWRHSDISVIWPVNTPTTIHATVTFSYPPLFDPENDTAIKGLFFLADAWTGGWSGSTIVEFAHAPAQTSDRGPVGEITAVNPSHLFDSSSFDVRGWAADPDTHYTTGEPVLAVLISDGKIHDARYASRPYTSTHTEYGGGPNGFDLSASLTKPGYTELCVFLYNLGDGTNQVIDCTTVYVPPRDPYGEAYTWVDNGKVWTMGWTVDPSNPHLELGTWLVVDGNVVQQFITNQPSPYLTPYGVGGYHAFIVGGFTPPPGKHEVCIYALNIGLGTSAWINCQNITV